MEQQDRSGDPAQEFGGSAEAGNDVRDGMSSVCASSKWLRADSSRITRLAGEDCSVLSFELKSDNLKLNTHN